MGMFFLYSFNKHIDAHYSSLAFACDLLIYFAFFTSPYIPLSIHNAYPGSIRRMSFLVIMMKPGHDMSFFSFFCVVMMTDSAASPGSPPSSSLLVVSVIVTC